MLGTTTYYMLEKQTLALCFKGSKDFVLTRMSYL